MPRSDPPDVPRPLRHWWIAVAVYVAAGVLWVVAGDAIVFTSLDDPRWLSLGKGIVFVVLSGVVAAIVLAGSQRRLERTLRQLSARESELAVLGANAQDLLFRVELVPEPRFAFVSDSAERIVGYTPQDHYDDPGLGRRLVHPDDLHLLDDPAAMVGTVRLRWIHRNGRVIWCEQQNQLQIENGQPVGMVGVARDVTAEVLRTGVAAAIAQLSGEVLEESLDVDASFGTAAEQLRVLFEAQAVRIDIAASGPCGREHRVVASGAHAAGGSGVTVLAARGATTVRVTTTAASPEPQLIERELATVAERIDGVHAAARRDWELRQLEQALESSTSAVLVTDATGRIEWVNGAFATLTGYPAEEVLGREVELLARGGQDALFGSRQAEALAEGRSFTARVRHHRRDGSAYTAAVAVDPVLDRDGKASGAVTVLRDVTQEEEERERVRVGELESLARRREIERDRSLLVQTISHELRTPLTVVLGTAETLTARGIDPERRELLVAALARAKGAVLGRLDVLLAATDGIEGPAEPIRARSLVEAALLSLWRGHDIDRVTIEGEVAWTGQHLLAKALLVPLLDNALTHSPPSTTVRVDLATADAGLEVAITDRGAGIPDEALARLDEPFHQADQGVTRERGGFGLGLYSARRVADRLGGSLELRRRAEGGTLVRVWLPDAGTVPEVGADGTADGAVSVASVVTEHPRRSSSA